MLGSGVHELLLVDTDAAHPLQPGRVVEDWVGVDGDRQVGGVQANPELDRRSGDREPLDVHHLANRSGARSVSDARRGI
jgi:hypothetical protein